jgi:hypothetical protein
MKYKKYNTKGERIVKWEDQQQNRKNKIDL